MLQHIRNNLREAHTALERFMNDEAALRRVEQAANLLGETLANEGKVYSCGNGGSMCDAMHFAEELTGRYRKNRPGIAAIAISDPSHISCVANDFGYEHVFSRYIESHARAGDCLVGISTSGKSATVLNAAAAARARGVKVIGLTGRADTPLEKLADVCVVTPGGEFADRVQELHIKIIHIWIELIERRFNPENYS